MPSPFSTDETYWLEVQLEEAEQRYADLQSQLAQEREERRQAYRDQADQYSRSATSWPEALHKQILLMSSESSEERFMWLEGWGVDDAFFLECQAACRRALKLWEHYQLDIVDDVHRIQLQIDELQEELDVLVESVRYKVCEHLEQEKQYPSRGWQSVANDLGDSGMDPEEWLNW